MDLAFGTGACVAAFFIGGVIYVSTGRKSLRSAYLWTIWVSLAVYGLGARSGYSLDEALWYPAASLVFAFVGHFIDRKKRPAPIQ